MNAPALHAFDAALGLKPGSAPQSYEVDTSEAYWNQAGPFGGWLVAIGLKAIMADCPAESHPIEAHARFFSAAKPGAVQLQVSCQQQGRSVGFWRATVTQLQDVEIRTLCEVSAIMAPERQTLDVVSAPMPPAPSPDTLRSVILREAPVRWIRHYEFRYIHGLPFVGDTSVEAAQLRSRLWVRESEARDLDWFNLAALCDVVIPRVFLLQRAPSPIATVSMSIHFHASAAEMAQSGHAWLLYDVTSHGARRGFFDHAVTLWREDGLALASSAQVAWFA